jgi:hypothetical protein
MIDEILKIKEYRDKYDEHYMKIYVNNQLVIEGIYDEYKIEAIRKTIIALQ